MRKASLAHTKAHLSAIVDAVEHRGKSVIILRHGKPAAAIVPVAVAVTPKRRGASLPPKAVRKSIRVFVEEFSAADPKTSAVADLLRGRR